MDFFFDNPLILIFLIAFLSSMFKGSKGNEKKKGPQRRPQQRLEPQKTQRRTEQRPLPKPFLEGPFQEPEIFRFPQPKVSSDIKKIEKEYEEEKKKAEESVAQLRNQVKEIRKKEEMIKALNNPQRKTELASKGTGDSSQFNENINERKIMDAIVWTEILGAPRGKRLYRLSKRNMMR